MAYEPEGEAVATGERRDDCDYEPDVVEGNEDPIPEETDYLNAVEGSDD